jgi:hypothetical protein
MKVDEVLRNPAEFYPTLPVWHPPISEFIETQPEPQLKVDVSGYHPAVDAIYTNGTGVSSKHPSIHNMLQDVLPTTSGPLARSTAELLLLVDSIGAHVCWT